MTQSIYLGVKTTGSINNILAIIARSNDTERAAAVDWYRNAHDDARGIAREYNLPLWTAAQLLSVISPQRKWDTNVVDTCRTIEAYAATPEMRLPYLFAHSTAMPSGYGCFNRAWEILDGTRELVRPGAPKTYDFAMTIMHPNTYLAPVVDSHAAALWSDDYHLVAGTYQVAKGLYQRISADYVSIAAEFGILPSEAQAWTWVARRRLLAQKADVVD